MSVKSLLKNWRISFAVIVLLLAFSTIAVNGVKFGIDFSGGTLFQIHFVEKVTDAGQRDEIRTIIQQRLDFSGLRDSTVQFVGNELVFAQLAETDPRQVERLEALLLRQGKFQAVIDGGEIFSGAGIVNISKDPQRGYGTLKIENAYNWTLPFTLNEKAARKFTEMTFHRCSRTGFNQETGQVEYDCDKTYFFIDRPEHAIMLIPKSVFRSDEQLLLQGNRVEGIPELTDIEEVMQNINIPFRVFDENSLISDLNLTPLLAAYKTIILPPETSEKVKQELESLGFKVNVLIAPRELPWVWFAGGLRELINLTPSVTNLEPFVSSLDSPDLKVYSSLQIEGSAPSQQEAQSSLRTLTILLESGSLPVAVDSISKETISPTLGKQFLLTAFLIAVITAIAVSLFLYFRYRVLNLVIPMLFTMLAETFIVIGVASILSWPLDLAAIAGVIAAVGTGVDDQIVITDELRRSRRESFGETSLVNRAKRAFFIVVAAAAASIATMLPLLIIGPSAGMGRLIGFAFTTIVGVLVGVLITRPAFQEIAKNVIAKLQAKETA